MAIGSKNYSLIEIKIQPHKGYDKGNDQLYILCRKSHLKG
jgi:hypothetical protein